jgi:hypothetical protein
MIQTIMRHSTITLTMDTYGHLFPGSEADAIDRLPDLWGAVPAQYSAGTSRHLGAQSPKLAKQPVSRQKSRKPYFFGG